jgi:hypothetical protein
MTKRDIIVIIVLAALAMFGVVLNILACALPHQNWYPFIVIVCYALAPFPNILCGMCNRGDILGSGNRSWKDAGFFITSFLVLSGFGVPAVELRAHAISTQAFLLSIFGGLVLYGAVLAYVHVFHGKKSDNTF